MNKIEIAYRRKSMKFSLPSGWEELTGKQVMAVCRLMQRGVDVANFKLLLCFALTPPRARRMLRRMLLRLYGYRRAARKARTKSHVQDEIMSLESQIVQLSETLDFVKTNGALKINPVPVFRFCGLGCDGCTAQQQT
jgi:hypothetical protein